MIKIKKFREKPLTLADIELTEDHIGREIICIQTHAAGLDRNYSPNYAVIEKGHIAQLESLETNWDKDYPNAVLSIKDHGYVRQRKFWTFYNK